MNNSWRKTLKDNEIIKQYYETLTPDKYREGIENAIHMTEQRLTKEYENSLIHIQDHYNNAIKEGVLLAMDTLAVEMIYELGNVLECYVDEPEYLDQKIDIVQGIYETAMKSIENYANQKYMTNKQAQKAFEKKKKLIQKYFGMSQSKNKKKGDEE